ncbi:hypothetical protein [Maribacter polysaccharolyticus]|uniref:hypothetical protein n=1 Tax=Maribacter polysaccharolyticus TaxID=3020831 RepID=UPI00237F57B1|nr:hypothetical protein [Maribacter polysaccharolyticus]MDE3743513.1 hypothetical protein [Maribacter polysaccharolyticus]
MNSIKKQKLIVLAQSLEQPRVVKRILKMSHKYDSVHVYGFLRDIKNVGNHLLLKNHPKIYLVIVQEIEDKKYFRRFVGLCKLLFLVYKEYGFGKKEVYVFGLDLRLLSFFIVKSNITYEISDIMWLYIEKPKRTILEYIDKNLAKLSSKVVFTSYEFYNKYYKGYVAKEKVTIEENKLETYGKVKPSEKFLTDQIRIAYIGAFRYNDIIKKLIDIVTSNKHITLNFYGDGYAETLHLIKIASNENSNIFYHGAFKNPNDLQRIYSENNLNFVVYQNTLENEQVAMPNKYYESGFFNIPIVCASKTYVGRRTVQNGMGWMVDIDQNSLSKFLTELKIEDLLLKHNKIKKLPKDMFAI